MSDTPQHEPAYFSDFAGTREQVTGMLTLRAEKDTIMKFFAFAHLPANLADVSFTYARQALALWESVPPCAERTVALRKLLESKDAAVRACL
jgi:hypothetical protein